jgi:NTP pyrophosphatase (non-canonical NTP hydrolase)
MNDNDTTVAELRRRLAQWVAAREWGKFHRPKNLAMSIAVEAAELMEHFQWLTHDEADELLRDEAVRREVADEMADVLSFLLSLANATNIDLAAAFEAKMARNELKYPADRVRGQYRKPRST